MRGPLGLRATSVYRGRTLKRRRGGQKSVTASRSEKVLPVSWIGPQRWPASRYPAPFGERSGNDFFSASRCTRDAGSAQTACAGPQSSKNQQISSASRARTSADERNKTRRIHSSIPPGDDSSFVWRGGRLRLGSARPRQGSRPDASVASAAGITSDHAIDDETKNSTHKLLRTPPPRSRRSAS
jgi:hypothetical protein